jgi:hypothetical protein
MRRLLKLKVLEQASRAAMLSLWEPPEHTIPDDVAGTEGDTQGTEDAADEASASAGVPNYWHVCAQCARRPRAQRDARIDSEVFESNRGVEGVAPLVAAVGRGGGGRWPSSPPPPRAPQANLDSAVRKLMLKCHPDKNASGNKGAMGSEEALRRSQEVTEARNVSCARSSSRKPSEALRAA